MSDLTPEEQSVKGTVILSAVTALLGVALGAVSLLGGAGSWSSFSRERALAPQGAEVALTIDDATHTYAPAPSRVSRGSAEVAWTAPRYECPSEASEPLARAEPQGQARHATYARAALKLRATEGKSLAKSVGRKDFKESLGEGVRVVADVAESARQKVSPSAPLPEAAYQVRAAWGVAQADWAETVRQGAGSPLRCLKESRPPDAAKSVVPVEYMMSEMVVRREPYVYIVPLLDAIDAVAGALQATRAEEAKTEASAPAATKPDCLGEEALKSDSTESPNDAREADKDATQGFVNCNAENPNAENPRED